MKPRAPSVLESPLEGWARPEVGFFGLSDLAYAAGLGAAWRHAMAVEMIAETLLENWPIEALAATVPVFSFDMDRLKVAKVSVEIAWQDGWKESCPVQASNAKKKLEQALLVVANTLDMWDMSPVERSMKCSEDRMLGIAQWKRLPMLSRPPELQAFLLHHRLENVFGSPSLGSARPRV